MRQLLWIALTAALAAPALAASTPQATSASGEKPAPGEKVICKSTPRIGSLARPKRVCLTKAAWEEMRRDAKEWGRERIDGCAVRNADPAGPGEPPVTC